MDRKTVLVVCIVLTSGILCLAIANLLSQLPKTITQEAKSEFEDLRFQKVETFMFTRTKYGGIITAVIYEDTETGVKYLYIWQGAMNGGPCITRLWEK